MPPFTYPSESVHETLEFETPCFPFSHVAVAQPSSVSAILPVVISFQRGVIALKFSLDNASAGYH